MIIKKMQSLILLLCFSLPFCTNMIFAEVEEIEKVCCSEKFWVTGEYLLSWLKDAPLVPLITTSPAGTPSISAGVLGQPGTTILFGNHDIDINARSGFRIDCGLYLDEKRQFTLEGNGFWIASKNQHFNASSTGDPILARPFFNVSSSQENASLIAFPGLNEGSINITTKSGSLWGVELNAAYHICKPRTFNCSSYEHCSKRLSGDIFVGFRFLRLQEKLSIQDQANAIFAPFEIVNNDSFRTYNNFYGLQLGGRLNWEKGCFFCDVYGQVGIGATHEKVNIQGSTVTTAAGVSTQFPEGFLALSTNIGNHRRTVFSVVPEIGFSLGIKPIEGLRVFMGYSFMYWNKVVRPGRQVNLNLNPNLFPPPIGGGPAEPSFSFHNSDFWKQTLNFGIGYLF